MKSVVVQERGGAPFQQMLFITGGTLILQRSGKSAQPAALSLMLVFKAIVNKKYFDFYFLPQFKSTSLFSLSLTYLLTWPPTWICVVPTSLRAYYE